MTMKLEWMTYIIKREALLSAFPQQKEKREDLRMKVFLVKAEKTSYDQYNAFVVIAENSYRAYEIAAGFFEPDQGKITVSEVDMTDEGIVLDSYCGG